MANPGDAYAIADLIGQCQNRYEGKIFELLAIFDILFLSFLTIFNHFLVESRELDRQIEDEKRKIEYFEAENRACKARIAQKGNIEIAFNQITIGILHTMFSHMDNLHFLNFRPDTEVDQS